MLTPDPCSRDEVMIEDTKHDPVVLTVFRSRLRLGAENKYRKMAAEMEARARTMPGLVSFKSFAADDGERVSIVVFDSWSTHRAWRDDPDHLLAQGLGRTQFYEQYDITVCEVARQRVFPERTG